MKPIPRQLRIQPETCLRFLFFHVGDYMRKMCFFFALMLLALSASGQRLPADIALPEHYQITLAPDFQKDNFRGEETLRIRVLKPTSSITLNSAAITFADTTITHGGTP